MTEKPTYEELEQRIAQLEKELAERTGIKDAYHALVEHAKDGIVIIQKFKVKFANKAFCDMIGVSEDEIIDAHLNEFISEEEFFKNTRRYSERVAGVNLPRIYQSQLQCVDGSAMDVELNVCVVPYGKSLAALVFAHSLEERDAWLSPDIIA